MVDRLRPLQKDDRVLLIRLGAVGDVLRTLPALHLIRTSFPTIHIAWMVEDLSRDLLRDHPEIDEVLRFPRRELRRNSLRPLPLARRLREITRELRGRGFTVALDFQGSLKSALLGLLSGAPRRIGFAPGHAREMSFLFTSEWVRPPHGALNRIERNLLLADAIGARGDTIEAVLPELPDEGRAAEDLIRDLNPRGLPLVVISPGTSQRQRRKRWPAERFAGLAESLASIAGVRPVLAWGPGEEELARSIVSRAGGGVVPLPATGLRLLAAVLRRSALFIGADTGPMHLAWAVGCPVLALFGPTDPRLNAPPGEGHIVLRPGRDTAAITTEEALRAARRLLERRPAGAGPIPRAALPSIPSTARR